MNSKPNIKGEMGLSKYRYLRTTRDSIFLLARRRAHKDEPRHDYLQSAQ